jgi:hypothetical protein
MNSETQIEKIIEQIEDEFLQIGWRFSETKFEIGEELPHSWVWDGDQWTDEALPGTCVFEDLNQVKEYAKYSKGYILLVGGVEIKTGDEPGELIFDEAKVFGIWDWNKK